MALLRVDTRYLANLLQLPAGVVVLDVQNDVNRADMLSIKIEGAGWPTRPGEQILPTRGTVTDVRDERGHLVSRNIDWGFPTTEQKEKHGEN